MTAPSRARRHAANVEVMRLEDWPTIRLAGDWAEEHGLRAVATSSSLHVYGQGGRLTARLGQVLTYDAATGEFAVLDAAVYDTTHTAAQGVAE